MNKYRKIPVEVEAILFTGDNKHEIEAFAALGTREVYIHKNSLEIHTFEGVMTAQVGDYIIKGVQGELYPCKPDIFKLTYEKVTE